MLLFANEILAHKISNSHLNYAEVHHRSKHNFLKININFITVNSVHVVNKNASLYSYNKVNSFYVSQIMLPTFSLHVHVSHPKLSSKRLMVVKRLKVHLLITIIPELPLFSACIN